MVLLIIKLVFVTYFLFVGEIFSLSDENSESCGCSATSRETASEERKDACFENEPLCENNVINKESKYTESKNLKITFIKGGKFQMGTDKPVFIADGEGPSRLVYVDDFYLDIYEVSNQDFQLFVESTGHVTEVCLVVKKL